MLFFRALMHASSDNNAIVSWLLIVRYGFQILARSNIFPSNIFYHALYIDNSIPDGQIPTGIYPCAVIQT
jgi:hypothetical protein